MKMAEKRNPVLVELVLVILFFALSSVTLAVWHNFCNVVPHQVIIPDLKVASSSVMMTLETFPISSLAS